MFLRSEVKRNLASIGTSYMITRHGYVKVSDIPLEIVKSQIITEVSLSVFWFVHLVLYTKEYTL
jgi:hypothetical protein